VASGKWLVAFVPVCVPVPEQWWWTHERTLKIPHPIHLGYSLH